MKKGMICILAVLWGMTSLFAQSVFPQHTPYGNGVGLFPGRVVWAHNPDSVDWDGSGYWWQWKNFDEKVILEMVNASIASLGGKETAAEGWSALFVAHNASDAARGRKTGTETENGYCPGEKIAIKANMNGSGVFDDRTDTRMSYTNPVLLKALLTSLVQEAGVSPEDITVYDASRVFPSYMMQLCSSGILRGIQFRYRDIMGKNDCVADKSAPVVWSQNFSREKNYLPRCVTEAKYLINLANLKGHSYGITLCSKNHFGSLMNSSRLRPPEAANLHQFLTTNRRNHYTVLVDLMANYQLGGKTFLYLLDALICAPSEGASITGDNAKWQQEPFHNDYTSSIFVSQDPVAIDSVGADFLMNEPTISNYNGAIRNNRNVENYLHEAGCVAAPPSEAVYRDGRGNIVTNLGVHEHWNSPDDKYYSRNLGKSEGIELVKVE